VLSLTIDFQSFEPVCWWNPQVVQRFSPVEHSQFPKRDLLYVLRKFSGPLPAKDLLHLSRPEGSDHAPMLYHVTS
jgi:hypothetical protein